MNSHLLLKDTHNQLLPKEIISSELLELKNDNLFLKRGIWLYFLLLIFEGALRKWFLPGLATPLLIVRDPLALYLIILCWQQGLLPKNLYLSWMVIIGFFGIITALILGHGSLPVAIFGARILLIHFPLVFVIGSIFNRDDVLQLGIVTLWISIPMAILVGLQFYSPQSAWVNRGVGGDLEGAGFSGAMGYFRPPGTFSFTNGTTLFFGFVSCYILYFWLNPKNVNRLILMGSTIGLLASIPFSISRALLFHIVIAILFAGLGAIRNPKLLGQTIITITAGIICFNLLAQTEFFQTSTEAFMSRFDKANETEGGVEGVFFDRYLGGLWGALTGSTSQPIFGYGIGMGTNVGSVLLTGKHQYLISEGEWGRLVGELGALMGIAVILIRVGLTAKIGLSSYKELVNGDLLPWMLFSFGLFTVPQSQWGQPTSLGFSTLIAGLMIASFKKPSLK